MGLLSWFSRERESAEQRSAWMDRALQVAAQQANITASRAFDAAQTTPWTESWTGAGTEINADIANGLNKSRQRSRDLARNYDYARGYLIRLNDHVVGDQGIQLQMRLLKRDGTRNTDANSAVEGGWRRWGRRGNCEVSGQWSWNDCEDVLLQTLARDGEYLLRIVIGQGPHRFQIQILRPDILDLECHREYEGRRVRMGKEIDDYGRPVAFWLIAKRVGDYMGTDMMSVGRHVRVTADRIIHGYFSEEPEQLRGYPWMAASARRLWMLKDYEKAAAVASSNAAKRLGFFVSPDGTAPPGMVDKIVDKVLEDARKSGRKLSADEVRTLANAAEKYTTTVEGQFDTIPQGYDFRQFQSQYPHVNYGEYTKECKRGFASGVGMSYVTTGNDLESVNYSSAQIGTTDEREHFKWIQSRFLDGLHARVFRAWLPYGMLADPAMARLNPSRIEEYIDAAAWQPRRWPGIDRVKEENANETRLLNRLTSRRRIMLDRGDDPDEIDAEIAADPFHPQVSSTAPTPPNDDNEDGSESADATNTPAGRRLRAVNSED
jgi:lambda family phage portal protein